MRVAAVDVARLVGSVGVSRLALARVPARDLSGHWPRMPCEFYADDSGLDHNNYSSLYINWRVLVTYVVGYGVLYI